jgi:valyl-tRNA synthetase
MSLPKRYKPDRREPKIAEQWRKSGVYHFQKDDERPVYSIDTPPPTVSGHLHLGHVYSYSHTDFMARFWRMNGYNVYYPMGFDDNGLATERLVERLENVTAGQIGRSAFIERCLAVSREAEKEYETLWRRLGLSVDWRHTYRTIEARARRISQWSFIDLYRKELAYRRKAPVIWCPECQTAIARAEVDDLQRESTFYTLGFRRDDGETLPISTTRPELLAACVAIFVHPQDPRAGELDGRSATVPLFGQEVPILSDPGVDPHTGTGLVMCCTFGDTADVEWWYTHELPLVEAIGRDGRLLSPAGDYEGLSIPEARRQIVETLAQEALLLNREPTQQAVRVHERCDTPVEFIVTRQWFVSVLPFRQTLLDAGESVAWHPDHMKARYREWVEALAWDWCISRQRYSGVTFPVWYCDDCQTVILADEAMLPVDPTEEAPPRPCPHCGGRSFTPETDVMDTWATSSLTPQIAGYMFDDPALYDKVFPFSLRPQAHEIIRTWAFYTLAKSQHHFERLPWRDVAISGWGLARQGSGKISKSRGGGPMAPMAMIEQYSADAVRYWAASTGFGKDSVIDEEKIQAGAKLINKLWNVARFSQRFLEGYEAPDSPNEALLTPADRWLLSRSQRLVERVTTLFRQYDYATAKSEIERYFWTELADNYLEMAKRRLYAGDEAAAGARFTLQQGLMVTLKLFAPFLPYVTEAIYRDLLETGDSIHAAHWPAVRAEFIDDGAERTGEALVHVATVVRRFKSEEGLSLGTELARLHLAVEDAHLSQSLGEAEPDLASITRARRLTVGGTAPSELTVVDNDGHLTIALAG